jgi:hypothetical protein
VIQPAPLSLYGEAFFILAMLLRQILAREETHEVHR